MVTVHLIFITPYSLGAATMVVTSHAARYGVVAALASPPCAFTSSHRLYRSRHSPYSSGACAMSTVVPLQMWNRALWGSRRTEKTRKTHIKDAG